jgi:hypothetical protein
MPSLEGGAFNVHAPFKSLFQECVTPRALPHSCNKVQLERALYDVQRRLDPGFGSQFISGI